MRVSKRFRWEGAHRLPWHEGLCCNLHGHSYLMEVVVEGPVGERGMVIDFHDVKAVIKPLVQAWDHATFVAHDDDELLGIVKQTGWKHYVLPFDSTSENLAQYVADHLCRESAETFARIGVTGVRVRVEETQTCYAEVEVALPATRSERAGPGHTTFASQSTQPGPTEPPSLHML